MALQDASISAGLLFAARGSSLKFEASSLITFRSMLFGEKMHEINACNSSLCILFLDLGSDCRITAVRRGGASNAEQANAE